MPNHLLEVEGVSHSCKVSFVVAAFFAAPYLMQSMIHVVKMQGMLEIEALRTFVLQ